MAVLSLAFALHSVAQDFARGLILKDGSHQLVTLYEVKGDRVTLHQRRTQRVGGTSLFTSRLACHRECEKDRVTSAIAEAGSECQRLSMWLLPFTLRPTQWAWFLQHRGGGRPCPAMRNESTNYETNPTVSNFQLPGA